MLERRSHSRRRDLAPGTIAYGRQRATLDCVVRDLSEGGAMLVLDEPRRAPVEMVLALRGGVRPARIVWRSDAGVGVAFTAAEAPPAPAPRAGEVVSLDDARRARTGLSDERRLAERIARFVRPSRGLDGR